MTILIALVTFHQPQASADRHSAEPSGVPKRVVADVEAVQDPVAATPLPEPPPPPTAPVAAPVQPTSYGGDIRGIIIAAANAHGISADMMLRIAQCESGMNPNARNTNYYAPGYGNPVGLFQHVEGYWPARASKYGYPGASVFDPVANANVTAAMMRAEGTSAWECR